MRVMVMSKQQPTSKKPLVNLPFPMPNAEQSADDVAHNQVRPKPEQNSMQIVLGCHHVAPVVQWVNV